MNPRFKVGDRIVAPVLPLLFARSDKDMVGTIEYVIPKMMFDGSIMPGYLVHWDEPRENVTDYDLLIDYGLELLEES